MTESQTVALNHALRERAISLDQYVIIMSEDARNRGAEVLHLASEPSRTSGSPKTQPELAFNLSVLDELLQLYSGVTWDGDLINKQGRNRLVQYGWAARHNGLNFITMDGVAALEHSSFLCNDGKVNYHAIYQLTGYSQHDPSNK